MSDMMGARQDDYPRRRVDVAVANAAYEGDPARPGGRGMGLAPPRIFHYFPSYEIGSCCSDPAPRLDGRFPFTVTPRRSSGTSEKLFFLRKIRAGRPRGRGAGVGKNRFERKRSLPVP